MGVLIQHQSAGISYYSKDKPLKRGDLAEPRRNTPLESAVAVATLLTFFAGFYVLPLALVAAQVLFLTPYRAVAWWMWAIFVVAWIVPAGKVWQPYRHSWVFDTWRRFFRMKVVLPELPFLSPDKHVMYVQCPHACFPMAGLLNFPLADREDVTGVPQPVTAAVADVLLQIPFYKHYFAWNGCYPANQQMLLRLLSKSTVGLLPEGVAGIFEGATRQRERVFIRKRKGFVRVAIKAGAGLLPVYQLGNSQMLSYCGFPNLSRRLRCTIGFFYGWWGLPLPYQHELITCIGPAVEVQQCDDPTTEQIDETHARFVAALQQLYYQQRHLVPGWENRPLEIV